MFVNPISVRIPAEINGERKEKNDPREGIENQIRQDDPDPDRSTNQNVVRAYEPNNANKTM